MHYLTPTDLLAIHELLLSEFSGCAALTWRMAGLSAVAALAQASMFGDELYPTLTAKAAALCQGIEVCAPFSDIAFLSV